MVLNPFDLAGAIANAITTLIKIHKADQWARLIFTIGFSFWTTGAFVTGSALVAGRGLLIATGMGLISASVMGTVIFRRSPLTKGMTVALPAEEAGKELNSDIQVISK